MMGAEPSSFTLIDANGCPYAFPLITKLESLGRPERTREDLGNSYWHILGLLVIVCVDGVQSCATELLDLRTR